MPANSGDKSRFHRLRKAKLARRVQSRAKRLTAVPRKPAKGGASE